MKIISETVLKVVIPMKGFELQHILQAHDTIMLRYGKEIDSIWMHPKVMIQIQDMLMAKNYSISYMGFRPITLFGIKIEVDARISEDVIELVTAAERVVSE